jgi:hypothetical protein
MSHETISPPVTPPQKNPMKAWAIHLSVYAVVVSLLAALNYVTGQPWWVLYVAAGWGIGILGHLTGALLKRRQIHAT